jgi:hypothetical protein
LPVVDIVVADEHPAVRVRLDDGENVSEELLAVLRNAGVDDHRSAARMTSVSSGAGNGPDRHVVVVEQERLGGDGGGSKRVLVIVSVASCASPRTGALGAERVKR